MGDNFTNRALGHRMDTLRNMADKYLSTMALQANAEANSTQASPTAPAKENKRGSSAVVSNAKAKSTTTTPTKANNDKAATKTSAAKNKVTKTTPVKGMTNAGVKKRSTPAPKGKIALKTEAKGKKEEVEEAGCDGAIESCPIYLIDVIRYNRSSNGHQTDAPTDQPSTLDGSLRHAVSN